MTDTGRIFEVLKTDKKIDYLQKTLFMIPFSLQPNVVDL